MKKKCKFSIRSLNQEKILNKLSKKINLYNYKKNEQNLFEFEVGLRDIRKTKALLHEEGCEILSVSIQGYFKTIKNVFSSFGVILALLIIAIIYSLQYFFVWEIEVFGTENSQKIENFIKISLNSRLKYHINTKELEIKVRENFPDVSSISVAIVGQSLIANINEALLPDEMGGQFSPIVSAYDGLITEINLVQGSLACKVGDIVKKGEVLVFPYIVDSQGERRDVCPRAEIIADVWISQSLKHFDKVIQTERTGNDVTISQVYLGKVLLYNQNKSVNFSQYEEETSVEELTKNLIFPLSLKRTTYFETQTIEKVEPFEENKEKIIADTRTKALIFLNKNEIIKEESYLIKEEATCHEVVYNLTVSRNIGG